MRTATIAKPLHVPIGDQRIHLHGVSWADFEAQLRIRGESPVPRISYLNGELELMSPSQDHERIKSYIGRLVEAYLYEAGIRFVPYGSWTLKEEVRNAGAEPDECYIFGADQTARVPELVIEVVWTSGGLDKLEIYLRLGVREFWQWRDDRIEVHVLRGGRYRRSRRSVALPELDLDLLVLHLDRPTVFDAVREYRAALSTRGGRSSRRR